MRLPACVAVVVESDVIESVEMSSLLGVCVRGAVVIRMRPHAARPHAPPRHPVRAGGGRKVSHVCGGSCAFLPCAPDAAAHVQRAGLGGRWLLTAQQPNRYPELQWGITPDLSVRKDYAWFLNQWEVLTALACLYVGFMVPFTLGFEKYYFADGEQCLFSSNAVPSNGTAFYVTRIVDIIVDLIFIVDIFINFVSARWVFRLEPMAHWTLVDDLSKIAQLYMSDMFVLDVLGKKNAPLPIFLPLQRNVCTGDRLYRPQSFRVEAFRKTGLALTYVHIHCAGSLPVQHLDCIEGVNAGFLKFARLLRLFKLFRLTRLATLISLVQRRFPSSIYVVAFIELFVCECDFKCLLHIVPIRLQRSGMRRN